MRNSSFIHIVAFLCNYSRYYSFIRLSVATYGMHAHACTSRQRRNETQSPTQGIAPTRPVFCRRRASRGLRGRNKTPLAAFCRFFRRRTLFYKYLPAPESDRYRGRRPRNVYHNEKDVRKMRTSSIFIRISGNVIRQQPRLPNNPLSGILFRRDRILCRHILSARLPS